MYKKLLVFLFCGVVIVFVCNLPARESGCRLNTNGFVDLFDYPENPDTADSLFLAYPLRDIMSRSDSFNYAIWTPNWLKKWNEPNLSLGYSGEDLFRITYEASFRKPVCIRFNNHQMIVKEGVSGKLYEEVDFNLLDSVARWQYWFIQKSVLRSTNHPTQQWLIMKDSVLNAVPQITTFQFYKTLLAKATVPDSAEFTYREHLIALSPELYCSLIKEMQDSEFGSSSFSAGQSGLCTDSDGYAIEAHLEKKYKLSKRNVCGDSSKVTAFCSRIFRIAGINDIADGLRLK